MPEQEEQPAKKKRITVADLEKQLDGLQTQITQGLNPAYTDLAKRLDELNLEDINKALEWCGELDVRLETLEEKTAAHNKTLLSDVKTRLAALEKGFLADAPPVWGEIDRRITALEKAAKDKPDSAVTNVTDRLFALENATGALADAVKEIVAGVKDWELRMEMAEDSIHSLQESCNRIANLAAHTEPVPLPRPIPEQEKHIDPDALKAIAAVAQNMGDVLSMTRVLQTAGGLSDDEKRQIVSIACQAAGVPYSENLLVRAGVRHFEA